MPKFPFSWISGCIVVAACAATNAAFADDAAKTIPHSRAHAHNDYRHAHPLADALAHGFTSVEADIHLVDDKLLVGHDRAELRPERSLESLYLDPLRERVRQNGGRVHRDGPEFVLLIDIKTSGDATYRVLRTVLSRYADILTSVTDGRESPRAVRAVISGNRPVALVEADSPRYVGIDGRLSDLDSKKPAHLMPLISDNWGVHFRWRGDDQPTKQESTRLDEIVGKAHAAGRRVRFWGTPDIPVVWKTLYAHGVDLINTDELAGLESLLLEQQSHENGLKLKYAGREALPDFVLDDRTARIHSQGLWVTQRHYCITGQLKSSPRKALFVRFDRADLKRVESIDITSHAGNGQGDGERLDHPGGFDCDGTKFWIPVAAGRPNSKSAIVTLINDPDRPLTAQKPREEFRVDDHIGALAFDRDNRRLYGANWDTRSIYVWKPDGTLIERWTQPPLVSSNDVRDQPGDEKPAIIAVQDWKSLGQGRVLAGAIDKSPLRPRAESPAILQLLDAANHSRIAWVRLASPPERDVTLTHEAVATFNGSIFFLPGDLGSGAEIYRYQWTNAVEQKATR